MLFSTLEFIFGFLPLVLAGYWLLARHETARLWFLLAASLAFYSYWDWRFTPLLVGGVVINWTAAQAFFRYRARGILIAAITANLICLGIFKYLGFFESIIVDGTGWNPSIARLALPLGISFFTFHHIIYLADLLRGTAPRYRFRDYAIYIALFPQILAGPLVRHHEIIPQLSSSPLRDGWEERTARGIALFLIGLGKKLFLADTLANIVDPAIAHTTTGVMTVGEAWSSTLAFPLQLYFDFSAYSDMAIGLALLLGLTLPYNFATPYRASSLQQFWRRWHMTLTRFLRDYLYIPLGGNRQTLPRHVIALMITLLLGGLWHGAGWTFIAWGALNGIGLAVEAVWRHCRLPPLPAVLGWGCVLIFWSFTLVFFRAPNLRAGLDILSAMAGHAPKGALVNWPLMLIGAAVAMIGPSSQEFAERLRPWRWLAPAAALATLIVLMRIGSHPSYEFIYFHF
jgi:D-alanyl-lipoteichoic acid acyltransferase DltB (MBOAT superfamily)